MTKRKLIEKAKRLQYVTNKVTAIKNKAKNILTEINKCISENESNKK